MAAGGRVSLCNKTLEQAIQQTAQGRMQLEFPDLMQALN